MWNLQHIFFSYEDEDIGRFWNLHQCTFKFLLSQDSHLLKVYAISQSSHYITLLHHIISTDNYHVKNQLPFLWLFCKEGF